MGAYQVDGPLIQGEGPVHLIGTDLQTYVDILVPSNAKLTLIQGEGPVHLIGSHCIDFFGGADEEADTEDEDDEMEVKGKGDALPASPIKTKSSPMDSKKRKASEDEKVVE